MHDRYEFSYHPRKKVNPKKLERTNSYLDITDRKTRRTKRFEYSKDLGEGTYGYVRLFTHGKEKIAVKALKENPKEGQEYDDRLRHLTLEEVEALKATLEKEKTSMQNAYRDQPYYSLHHYHEKEKNKKGYVYDCRLILPFIQGKKLDDFVRDEIDTPEEMAKLILRVCQELHRIHTEAGIIHGDAASRNILVSREGDDYRIHFLDFGMAYPKSGYAIVNFEKDKPGEKSGDMAPERIPDRKLKARPVQDVYSIAKSFRDMIISQGEEWAQDFYDKFPAVNDFIRDGIRDWKERPELSSFIHTLEISLDWRAHLPESLTDLIDVIENTSWLNLRKTKIKNISLNCPVPDLSILLQHLVLNQQYDAAIELMKSNRMIPAYAMNYGQTVLHLVAANSQIDIDTFKKFLDYIPVNGIAFQINIINRSGNSVLHVAAQAGNAEVVNLLLQNCSGLSVLNKDDESVMDVAKPHIKPLIKFYEYLFSLENISKQSSGKPRFFDNKTARKNQKLLAAANFIKESILSEPDADELEYYLDIIEDHSELSEIYHNLINAGFIQTEGLDFSIGF